MNTDDYPANNVVTNCPASSPWLTVSEAAERARCGVKTIYREVRAGRLKAARIGGRRELRILPEWIDDWLLQSATRLV
jgi:excisionase family DNA binding protein